MVLISPAWTDRVLASFVMALVLVACGQQSHREKPHGDSGVAQAGDATFGDGAGDTGQWEDDDLGDPGPGGDSQVPWQMPTLPTCEGAYAAPLAIDVSAPLALVEVSGIVASPQNSGVLWLHNDSGSESILYALDTDGQLLGTLELPTGTLIDAEDIAAGPCPNLPHTPCLWIADTGDNGLTRTDAALWVVQEPAVDSGAPFGTIGASTPWHFPITYDIGPTDVEAMVILPDGSAAYLFEKIDAANARMFELATPFVDNQPMVASTVATVSTPGLAIAKGRMITGADLHPSATRLVLRVYTGIFEYSLANRSLVDIDLITPQVVIWGPLSEPQGEAVAYAGSGIDLWSMSEDPQLGAVKPLHWYACTEN